MEPTYKNVRVHDSPGRHTRLEHRIVVERSIGRRLSRQEVVHHIDGNGLNNDLANLVVMSSLEHVNLHRAGKHLSAVTRARMSAAHMGKPKSQEHRAKLSVSRLRFFDMKRRREFGVVVCF